MTLVSSISLIFCFLFLLGSLLQFTTPADGINAGTYFGYGSSVPKGDKWKAIEGSFSLSSEGEQVFMYCYGGEGDAIPLAAISYNGGFQEPGMQTYGFNESALPASLLLNGTIVLPHGEDHWSYDGPSGVTDTELKEAFQDVENNWKGGSGRLSLSTSGGANVVSPLGLLRLFATTAAGISMLATLL
jgi:hypothetical protein